MKLPAYKVIALDWDGTLCDSLSRIVTCLQLSASQLGLPVPTNDEGREIIGLGLDEALGRLFPGINKHGIRDIREVYARYYIEQDKEPSGFYEGVLDTLENLKLRGFTLAIATGKSRKGLDRVLFSHGMQDFFHASRCADETASKPDPLMLKELMAEFSCPPESLLMVGDTEFDMDMARRAGVPRLAVSYGAHAAERLHQFEIEGCLDEFSSINNYV